MYRGMLLGATNTTGQEAKFSTSVAVGENLSDLPDKAERDRQRRIESSADDVAWPESRELLKNPRVD
jgi:hypothetical protein